MEPAAPEWLREIDHTADTGIEVVAPSLDVLFARAAWGMFTVLAEPAQVSPRHARDVVLEAADRDALLFAWLSELNFIHITEGWLFSAFDVALDGERRLRAHARGEPYDPARHTLHTEIKAVTYHGLDIRQEAGTWRVTVIFDL